MVLLVPPVRLFLRTAATGLAEAMELPGARCVLAEAKALWHKALERLISSKAHPVLAIRIAEDWEKATADFRGAARGGGAR